MIFIGCLHGSENTQLRKEFLKGMPKDLLKDFLKVEFLKNLLKGDFLVAFLKDFLKVDFLKDFLKVS